MRALRHLPRPAPGHRRHRGRPDAALRRRTARATGPVVAGRVPHRTAARGSGTRLGAGPRLAPGARLGLELSEQGVAGRAARLVAQHYLDRDLLGERILRSTDASPLVLRGDVAVHLRKEHPVAAAATGATTRRRRSTGADDNTTPLGPSPSHEDAQGLRPGRPATVPRRPRPGGAGRLDALHAWRLEESHGLSLQPFFILSDRTLVAIAERDPPATTTCSPSRASGPRSSSAGATRSSGAGGPTYVELIRRRRRGGPDDYTRSRNTRWNTPARPNSASRRARLRRGSR